MDACIDRKTFANSKSLKHFFLSPLHAVYKPVRSNPRLRLRSHELPMMSHTLCTSFENLSTACYIKRRAHFCPLHYGASKSIICWVRFLIPWWVCLSGRANLCAHCTAISCCCPLDIKFAQVLFLPRLRHIGWGAQIAKRRKKLFSEFAQKGF